MPSIASRVMPRNRPLRICIQPSKFGENALDKHFVAQMRRDFQESDVWAEPTPQTLTESPNTFRLPKRAARTIERRQAAAGKENRHWTGARTGREGDLLPQSIDLLRRRLNKQLVVETCVFPNGSARSRVHSSRIEATRNDQLRDPGERGGREAIRAGAVAGLEQFRRQETERDRAAHSEEEDEAEQHERRADKASYLREKLEERAEAERGAARRDEGG